MTIDILRLDPQSAAALGPTDPEIFDHPLDPARLQAFVACPTHLLVVALRRRARHRPDPRHAAPAARRADPALHRQPRRGPHASAPRHRAPPPAEVLLWGKAHGCAEAWVATEPDNAAARALYAGFMTEPEATASVFVIALP